MAALTLRAPAKLNLYLHITGKRADGYHALESLVVFADLVDELNFSVAETLSLRVEGEFAPQSGDADQNLVLRAARALQAATGYRGGASIRLTKNVPVGAGLGGGSADAAATLNGLNQLWQCGLSAAQLHALAVPLGADVAMCLDPKPAIVRGIGDVIAPLKASLPPMAALLVYPRVPLLTKDVYDALARLPSPEIANNDFEYSAEKSRTAFVAELARTHNHLQPPAIAVNPLVAEVLLALETVLLKPELVRMTGSGACCFALYTSLDEARRAEKILTAEYPEWWVRAVQIRG